MRELDIAALMCSKICHDLISPVGALANGLEVLADEKDEEMRRHAMSLIDVSVRTASAKLQFARLAFGAGGSANDVIDLTYAEKVAASFFESGKATLDWRMPAMTLPKDTVRLLLNLLVLAGDAIPRGGTVEVAGEDTACTRLVVIARGAHARLPEGLRFFDEMPVSTGELDARAIQPFTTALLATEIGARFSSELAQDVVTFRIDLPEAALAA